MKTQTFKHFLSIIAILTFFGQVVFAQVASHHLLTPQQYQKKYDDYKKKGYRLTHVDGFNVGHKIYYAASWAKSKGPQIAARHGMTASQYQAKYDEFKKKGYRLALIDGVKNGTKASYTAIWKKQAGLPMKTHHGMTDEVYGKKYVEYKKKGFRLIWIEGFSVNQKPYFNAIWEKKSGPNLATFHKMTSNEYQAKVNDYSRKGYQLRLVNAYNVGHTDYYAAIWEKKPARRGLSARHRLGKLGYQNEFENHKYSGYRLKHVSGYSIKGKAKFAAIWVTTNAWSKNDRVTIDKKMRAFMQKHNIPGASIALIKNEKLMFAKGYGVLDKSTGTPVGPNSLFRIASVSKPITATAIMKLRDKHPNLLDEKVFGRGNILGSKYHTLPLHQKEKAITVQHLLEHSAGGKQWDNKNDDGHKDPMMQRPLLNQKDLIKWVLNTRNPEKMPDKKYAYSNFGYCVLGKVIEEKWGKGTYAQYVKKHILKPAGITNMQLARNKKKDKLYNEATYHHSEAYVRNIRRMAAHGGWVASAIDLAKFLVRVDGRSGKKDVVSKYGYLKMISPTKVNNNYGKGWGRSNKSSWHSGYLWGTGAMIYNRPNGHSWVILYNASWERDTDAMMKDITNSIKTWPTHDLF